MRYEGHGWDPKGPASIHRTRAALDKDGAVIGYVFESKGFSRIDIGHQRKRPELQPRRQDQSDRLPATRGTAIDASQKLSLRPGCAEIVFVGDGMEKPMLSRALMPAFSGEVFFLSCSQHLRQLGIPAVIGQDEHHRVIRLAVARNWGIWRRLLPPMRPRLQPENDRRDAAPLGGSEQKAGDRRSGLGDAAIKVIAETLA